MDLLALGVNKENVHGDREISDDADFSARSIGAFRLMTPMRPRPILSERLLNDGQLREALVKAAIEYEKAAAIEEASF